MGRWAPCSRGGRPRSSPGAWPQARRTGWRRARLEVFEVEAEDVVALDDVGILLQDEARRLLQQRPLVETIAAHDVAEARGVGERDGDDPVGFAQRARELVALARHDLDVQGQAAEIAEAQGADRRPPARQHVLLHRVRYE